MCIYIYIYIYIFIYVCWKWKITCRYMHDQIEAKSGKINQPADARDKAENKNACVRSPPIHIRVTHVHIYNQYYHIVYFSFYHREPPFLSRTMTFESICFISFIRLPNIYQTFRRGHQRTKRDRRLWETKKKRKRGKRKSTENPSP